VGFEESRVAEVNGWPGFFIGEKGEIKPYAFQPVYLAIGDQQFAKSKVAFGVIDDGKGERVII